MGPVCFIIGDQGAQVYDWSESVLSFPARKAVDFEAFFIQRGMGPGIDFF